LDFPSTVRVIITEIIESLLWMYDIARLLKIINAIRIACHLVQAQAPLDSKYVEQLLRPKFQRKLQLSTQLPTRMLSLHQQLTVYRNI